MAKDAAATVMRVIRSTADASSAGPSDRDLLRRFATAEDQAAFAAIVRRHGPLVLGVCRRVLPNLQDAEDACQATFLVLAQKAKGNRWQPSIANWLYATARKVAGNARVAAQRRARRESRAAVPVAVQPVDQMTGRELLVTLDEELDNLPPRYREPLLLCYLEGLTRDEAAHRLHIPAATLKTRLERGRKRLGDALTRRGCVLGAGLLALAATSPAGASPSVLVRVVLTAVTQPPPAAVAALAEEVAVNGVISKSVLLVLALFGTVTLGTGWRGFPVTFAGQQPAEPGLAAAAKPDHDKARGARPPAERLTQISGRVLAPDGKPATNAAIYLLGWTPHGKSLPPQHVTTSDSEGRFTVDTQRLPAGAMAATIAATARTAAPDWVRLDEFGSEITLRLATDVPIRGRLLDLEGKPIAGVRVKVVAIGTSNGGNLQSALNAMRLNPEWVHFDKYLPALPPLVAAEPTTAADGWFELTGIGRDRIATLRFEAAGVEAAKVHVVTQPDFDASTMRPDAKDKEIMARGFAPGLRLAVYGPSFTHPAQPSHEIIGTVTDAATGKPVPNATIVGAAGTTYASGEPLWNNAVEARTDQDGRFRLSGLPKDRRRFLHIQPGDNPYLDQLVTVSDTEGLAPATVAIKLDRCVVVEGRIADSATGQPVQGLARYLPMTDNAELRTPTVARVYNRGLFSSHPTGTWAYTDDAGRFKLRVLHGPGVILARADTERDPAARYPAIRVAEPDRKYLRTRDPAATNTRMLQGAMTKDRSEDDESFSTGVEMAPLRWENGYAIINPGANDATLTVDIRFEPGLTVSGKVVGPDGRPLTGVKAVGVQATNEAKPTTFREDTFTAYALMANQPREMYFLHEELKLVGTITVRAGDKDPSVKLQPWASVIGRVLNPDGTPAASADVAFQLTDGIADEFIRQRLNGNQQRPIRADKDGRFRVEGMFPGQEVAIFAHAAGLRFGASAPPVIPKPGETVDVGQIKLPSGRD